MFKSKKVEKLENTILLMQVDSAIANIGVSSSSKVLELEIKKLENGEEVDVDALKAVLKALNMSCSVLDEIIKL